MPRPMSLGTDQVAELRKEATRRRAQGETTLGPWLAGLAPLYGVSLTTLYRMVEPEVRQRRRRADAGVLRAADGDEETLKLIAALVVQHDYAAELALATVQLQRKTAGLPPLDISVATINRHLQRWGVSRREAGIDKRVHRRWQAPYAGYLWQMDSTVSGSYYIEHDDTIGYEAPVRVNKTKAGNGRPRVWLISIVDDYSRVAWARFTTGNDAVCWIDTLTRAMREGAFAQPTRWPAYGVPERLYTDNDSVVKSTEWVSVCQGLGINHRKAPHSTEHETHAQAKGKVERLGGKILHGFEVVTRLVRFTSLAAMNQALIEYLIYQGNKHRADLDDQAPFERWIATAQTRQLPDAEITRVLSAKTRECKVYSDLSIKLDGKLYQLPRRAPFANLVGGKDSKVTVRYYRADMSTIQVLIDGEAHQVDAIAAVPDVAGEFHAAPVPDAVRNKRELLAVDLTALKAVAHDVFAAANRADKREYPIRPVPAPHPLQTAAVAALMIRRVYAIKRLQSEGLVAAPPSAEQRTQLDQLFGGRQEIPESELNAFILDARNPAERPAAVLRIA